MDHQMTSLLIVLVSCCVPAGATITPLIHSYADVGLNGEAFSDYVVFESPATSVIGCALLCTQQGPCVTFTFHEKTCRGHGVLLNATSASVPAPGAKSFAASEFVRYALCWENSDCRGTHVECFKGRCLCTPGYFYSVNTNACVLNCSSLQSTYTVYPGCGIDSSNEERMKKTTPSACQALCTADPLCLTCEITLMDRCHTHHVTALTPGVSWSTDNPTWWRDFYQRDCA